MQAACNENHPIPHQDATHEASTRVRLPSLSPSSSSQSSADILCFLKLVNRPKLIGVKKKLDRREAVRERKALSAAKLERSIEAELIERLKSKAYGDAPLNVNEEVWQAVLDRERKGKEKEMVLGDDGLEMEDDETEEEDEEELELEEGDEEGWGEREFVSDVSGDEDELSDLEDALVCGFFSLRIHNYN